jgi:broad specificity polyphosphatase/5'/3'-nucleotidase SurE
MNLSVARAEEVADVNVTVVCPERQLSGHEIRTLLARSLAAFDPAEAAEIKGVRARTTSL